MATYPAYSWIEEGSSVERDGGYLVDQADDGTTYIRSAYASDARMITIVHELSQSERDTLNTFYNARKTDNAAFDIVIPGSGESVSARFISALNGADVLYGSLGLKYRIVVKLAVM